MLTKSSRQLMPIINKFMLQNVFSYSTSSSPIRVENLLIIGSGLMGSGIAQSTASSGQFKSVVLQDVSQTQLDKAKAGIETSLKRIQKKNPSVDPSKIVDSITFSTQLKEKDIGNGLLVIEAIPEILEAKQELFKNL